MTEEEFDAFYTTAFPRLVGQLAAVTRDEGEAQDAVQEAFLRAWCRRSGLRVEAAPEAWIRTVAVRLVISRRRRARRWRELVGPGAAPDGVPGPGPEHTVLVQALRRLPRAQRDAVVLHHLCDWSVEQVAARTQAPPGTVKARLSRGRAALAVLLSGGEREREWEWGGETAMGVAVRG
ncbi:SigE family RNA polymerase sigma factor [Streptomyces sp. NPDC000594]|uniref:SigE family RNA polymerase sigma factor n=1 Tax=Streptomyces sp. NPDC000594 TaxID=3154261 RepID=UPI003322DDD3